MSTLQITQHVDRDSLFLIKAKHYPKSDGCHEFGTVEFNVDGNEISYTFHNVDLYREFCDEHNIDHGIKDEQPA